MFGVANRAAAGVADLRNATLPRFSRMSVTGSAQAEARALVGFSPIPSFFMR